MLALGISFASLLSQSGIGNAPLAIMNLRAINSYKISIDVGTIPNVMLVNKVTLNDKVSNMETQCDAGNYASLKC